MSEPKVLLEFVTGGVACFISADPDGARSVRFKDTGQHPGWDGSLVSSEDEALTLAVYDAMALQLAEARAEAKTLASMVVEYLKADREHANFDCPHDAEMWCRCGDASNELWSKVTIACQELEGVARRVLAREEGR